MADNKEKKVETKKEEKKLSFKDRMLKLKEKALEIKDDLVEKWAESIAKSSLVLKEKEDLDKIIEKTTPKEFTSKETGEKKVFKKYAVVIFVKKDTDFYKEALIEIPVLATKAWSQNIPLKITELSYKGVKNFPSLVVFENKKIYKTLEGEENIKKIVKNVDFDIIKQIENLTTKD